MDSKTTYTFIKEQWEKVATFFKTKNVVTFLLFLLLASGLWLMHSTSSQREMRSKAIIKYTGIPSYVVLNDDLPQKIEYMVKDENKQLWNYFSYSFDTLTINLSDQFEKGNNILEIEYETHLHKLITQFSPTSKITDLTPNVFTTTYITLQTKKVPLKLKGKVRINPQYVLTDSIGVHPTEITIIGVQSKLDSIDAITIEIPNTTISKSQSIRCRPILPQDIKSSTTDVSIDVQVEMSTEKQLSIPITALNMPETISIKTFPSEVNAIFNVGLSKYNAVTAKDIEIAIDYYTIQNNTTPTQKLHINKKPDYIYNLRFNPKSVEYIIENQTTE